MPHLCPGIPKTPSSLILICQLMEVESSTFTTSSEACLPVTSSLACCSWMRGASLPGAFYLFIYFIFIDKTSSRVHGVVSCPVMSCSVLSEADLCPLGKSRTSPGLDDICHTYFGLLIRRCKGPCGSGRIQKNGSHMGYVGSV